MTAYSDRDDWAFKRSVSELAWRSFGWFTQSRNTWSLCIAVAGWATAAFGVDELGS